VGAHAGTPWESTGGSGQTNHSDKLPGVLSSPLIAAVASATVRRCWPARARPGLYSAFAKEQEMYVQGGSPADAVSSSRPRTTDEPTQMASAYTSETLRPLCPQVPRFPRKLSRGLFWSTRFCTSFCLPPHQSTGSSVFEQTKLRYRSQAKEFSQHSTGPSFPGGHR